MSGFYHYDAILDVMSTMINSKCLPDTKIDTKTAAYVSFKEELATYRLIQIRKAKSFREKEKAFVHKLFDQQYADQETDMCHKTVDKFQSHGIYSYLDYQATPLASAEKVKMIVEQTKMSVAAETVSADYSFVHILGLIMGFYAQSGINIAIKFGEFYQLQKAYVLLLGVLKQTEYSTHRINIIMHRAIVNWQHLPQLLKVQTTYHVIKTFWAEKKKFDAVLKNPIPKA